jgi:hypothetical protein
VASPGVGPEDRPGDILANGIQHSALYLGFTYTAQTTQLVIKAAVPIFAPVGSGSFHLYGLSNEVAAPAEPVSPVITGIVRVTTGPSAGAILLQFTGAPNTTYDVTKSTNLQAFGPLDIPLASTTDGDGLGQVLVPASEVNPNTDRTELYRLEEDE